MGRAISARGRPPELRTADRTSRCPSPTWYSGELPDEQSVPALAGGTEITLACDLVVASRSATFGIPRAVGAEYLDVKRPEVPPPSEVGMVPEERVPPYSWYALAVLTAVYVLNFLDRQLIYILFVPIKAEMHFTDLQTALLAAAELRRLEGGHALLELALHQPHMSKRDITCNINFFMNVPVTPEGRLTFEDGISDAGKYVEMRAEMPVLVLVSNCPQLNNPCNGFDPTPVRMVVTDPSEG